MKQGITVTIIAFVLAACADPYEIIPPAKPIPADVKIAPERRATCAVVHDRAASIMAAREKLVEQFITLGAARSVTDSVVRGYLIEAVADAYAYPIVSTLVDETYADLFGDKWERACLLGTLPEAV